MEIRYIIKMGVYLFTFWIFGNFEKFRKVWMFGNACLYVWCVLYYKKKINTCIGFGVIFCNYI